MDAEQTYNAGVREQQVPPGTLTIPKINVKVSSNGQLYENLDQYTPGASSSNQRNIPRHPPQQAATFEGIDALSASARKQQQVQAGFRLNPYLVEKMAKQIRALSQTPH